MDTTSVGWECLAGNTGGSVGGLAIATLNGAALTYAATAVGVFRSVDAGHSWVLAGIRNTVPFAEAVVSSACFEQDRTLFACAADGLYRSADAGESWQPVLVGGRMLSVASARTALLAGTESDGVLRSEDGGRTWTGANAGLLDLTALAIGVSPRFAEDRLGFAGTASGLYRTRNGARSWRQVETGIDEPAVQCVAFSPTFGEDRLVLAGTEADGLLRSEDGGGTWHRPAALLGEGVTAVAFSTRYASRRTIAVAIEAGIAVSEDAGLSWRRSRASPPGVVLSLLFVSDGDGEVLLAGLHREGVARSADLGESWQRANDGLNARLLTRLALTPAFAQDQTVFAAGPQDGLSVSTDAGRGWVERNAGLEDQGVMGLALSPRFAHDRTLYIASAAGLYVSRDAAATWSLSPSPSGPLRAVATTAGTLPARTSPQAALSAPTAFAALAGGVVAASDDGGASWRMLPRIAERAEIQLLAPSPDYARDRTIYAATRESAPGDTGEVVVWRSVDGGERWSRWLVDREVGVADGQRFLALAIAPGDATGTRVFVGLGPRVFTPLPRVAAVHAGQRRPVWRPVDLGEGALAVTDIAPTPSYAADQTVFVASNAGIFVSRNGGATFGPWSEGLSPSSTVAVAVSPAFRDDRLVYALGLGGTIWRRRDSP